MSQWRVEWRGRSYYTDDLTLDEIDALERTFEVAWWSLEPLGRIAHAKVLLAVFALRDGAEPEQLKAQIAELRFRDVRSAFTLVDDDPALLDTATDAARDTDADPPAPSPADGSDGQRHGMDGHRPSPELSDSATSTPS